MLKIQQQQLRQQTGRASCSVVSRYTKGFRDNKSHVCVETQSSVWKTTQQGQNSSGAGCLVELLLVNYCPWKRNCRCKRCENSTELEHSESIYTSAKAVQSSEVVILLKNLLKAVLLTCQCQKKHKGNSIHTREQVCTIPEPGAQKWDPTKLWKCLFLCSMLRNS